MKRTPLARKSRLKTKSRLTAKKGLTPTRLRKRGKSELSVVQRELWELCRELASILYVEPDGTYKCYSCGRENIKGSNRHLGHFIPKAASNALMKYNMDNLRFQCYNCNINLSGNWSDFIVHYWSEMGEDAYKKLIEDNKKIVKALDHYKELIVVYKKRINELKESKRTPNQTS